MIREKRKAGSNPAAMPAARKPHVLAIGPFSKHPGRRAKGHAQADLMRAPRRAIAMTLYTPIVYQGQTDASENTDNPQRRGCANVKRSRK